MVGAGIEENNIKVLARLKRPVAVSMGPQFEAGEIDI